MPTRHEQKAETRAQIIQAAAQEFGVHGYRGTSFASIAEAMGRPKSALGYHQFRSKEELAAAVVHLQNARWEELRVAVQNGVRPGVPRLLSLLLTAALDARENPLGLAALRLLLERQSNGLELPPGAFGWRASARTQLNEAVRLGQLPDATEVSAATGIILNASLGLFEAENRGLQAADSRRELKALWRTLLAGLGAADVDGLLRDTVVVVPLTSELDRVRESGGAGGVPEPGTQRLLLPLSLESETP
ncbi:TetR/AcrR family transcriptional regulator [Herbiconiux sp. 11R-BC]|uniref:TetR family transcriptional regulator n=1 Tax=Herbiconiux sp. 11R-BC TaxID=3111637 RepID=UPI003C0EC58C